MIRARLHPQLMSGGSIDRELWGTDATAVKWMRKLQWAHDVAVAMNVIHSKGFLHRSVRIHLWAGLLRPILLSMRFLGVTTMCLLACVCLAGT